MRLWSDCAEAATIVLLQDLSHTAAFGSSSPLGKPLACPKRNFGAVTPEVLSAFVSEQYSPSKMVRACSHRRRPAAAARLHFERTTALRTLKRVHVLTHQHMRTGAGCRGL